MPQVATPFCDPTLLFGERQFCMDLRKSRSRLSRPRAHRTPCCCPSPPEIIITASASGALCSIGTGVFLDEYTPAGTLVQSVCRQPNERTSPRLVRRRLGISVAPQDGRHLVVPYDALAATVTSSTTVPRGIGRVDSNGVPMPALRQPTRNNVHDRPRRDQRDGHQHDEREHQTDRSFFRSVVRQFRRFDRLSSRHHRYRNANNRRTGRHHSSRFSGDPDPQ